MFTLTNIIKIQYKNQLKQLYNLVAVLSALLNDLQNFAHP